MVMKKNTIEATSFKPHRDKVFVTDLDHGERRSRGGIILTDDNMSERGIRERWARVHSVGPEIDDLAPGQWVLIQHGRWTEGMQFSLPEGDIMLWMIDYPEAVLLVADEDPRQPR